MAEDITSDDVIAYLCGSLPLSPLSHFISCEQKNFLSFFFPSHNLVRVFVCVSVGDDASSENTSRSCTSRENNNKKGKRKGKGRDIKSMSYSGNNSAVIASQRGLCYYSLNLVPKLLLFLPPSIIKYILFLVYLAMAMTNF